MTYRHLKGGSLYDITGVIRMQTDTPILDNQQIITYRSRADGELWGRPPAEMFDINRFKPEGPVITPGHLVTKHTGYPFPGEVRSVFWTRNGQRRFVVEATGADYAGMLHIFNGSQLLFQDGRAVESD